MKLLFFISSLRGGGAERVMSLLTNELSRRGHEIKLAVTTNDSSFYEFNESISIENFDFKRSKTLFGKIVNRIRLMSFIRKISIKEKPDVIISFIYQTNTNVLLSNLFLDIPIIACEHNTLDKKMSFFEHIQRFHIAKLADKLAVLTQHDFKFLGKRLKNKIVMNNPISFEPIARFNDDREKVIVAVGAVKRYTHKGFDNLIHIWHEVGDEFPDWKLCIAGDYDEDSLSYLQNIEQNLGTNNKIEYLGQLQDISSLLRLSSIFILSSRWEGFPMVLIEAMSQGCTSISYDVTSGPREIINDKRDGILVLNQSKTEMIKELRNLMNDSVRRRELSEEAISSISRFSIEKTVDRWEQIFIELKSKK